MFDGKCISFICMMLCFSLFCILYKKILVTSYITIFILTCFNGHLIIKLRYILCSANALHNIIDHFVDNSITDNHNYCILELKQILDSFGYSLSCIGIQIPREVFGCTVNKNSALIPAYFVINYKFKGISVIK